jgi:hypothetical protein
VDFLHKRLHLNHGQSVVVTLDHQANVILLDDDNFGRYKSGQEFRHFGGHAKQSPITIPAPSAGYWNVVIDLGGGSGQIRHSIAVVG